MKTKERLLDFLKYIKIGQNKFAEKCGFSAGYINNIKGSIGTDILKKIMDTYPELNIDWLLHGNGEMLKKSEEQHTAQLYEQENYRLIPVCSQDVVGGISNEECDSAGYITGYIPFVNAKDGDIAVPVTNDSMYPTYPPGSFVQIRKLELWSEVMEFGQVYIIELIDDRRLIKKVRKGADKQHYVLVSENKEYDDIDIDIKYIRSVWLVLAKYQKNVM